MDRTASLALNLHFVSLRNAFSDADRLAAGTDIVGGIGAVLVELALGDATAFLNRTSARQSSGTAPKRCLHRCLALRAGDEQIDNTKLHIVLQPVAEPDDVRPLVADDLAVHAQVLASDRDEVVQALVGQSLVLPVLVSLDGYTEASCLKAVVSLPAS